MPKFFLSRFQKYNPIPNLAVTGALFDPVKTINTNAAMELLMRVLGLAGPLVCRRSARA